MNPNPVPVDWVLEHTARVRRDADTLCRASSALVLEARRAWSAVGDARRRPVFRRVLGIRSGGRDATAPATVDAPARVRSKLARGGLRADPCTSGAVVALGSRLPCHGCDEAIPVDEVELRARFADGAFLRFHARCFAAWQTEIQE